MRLGRYVTVDWPVFIGCVMTTTGCTLEWGAFGFMIGGGLATLLGELNRKLIREDK